MTDAASTSSDTAAAAAAPAATPAASTVTYPTEAALRTAVVGYLQQAQAALTAGASLFPKALPADLDQLSTLLRVRIKNLPI